MKKRTIAYLLTLTICSITSMSVYAEEKPGEDMEFVYVTQDIANPYFIKGTEKLPFFLKWKFFFYIFSIFF